MRSPSTGPAEPMHSPSRAASTSRRVALTIHQALAAADELACVHRDMADQEPNLTGPARTLAAWTRDSLTVAAHEAAPIIAPVRPEDIHANRIVPLPTSSGTSCSRKPSNSSTPAGQLCSPAASSPTCHAAADRRKKPTKNQAAPGVDRTISSLVAVGRRSTDPRAGDTPGVKVRSIRMRPTSSAS